MTSLDCRQTPRAGDLSARLRQIATLAALYALAGALGLLFVEPPGYASVVWPAAGLALAGLTVFGSALWPGVFFGSLLVAMLTVTGGRAEIVPLADLAVAVSIAAGAAAQALLGAVLMRRFADRRMHFSNLRRLIPPFLLVGPLACCVSASLGTAALHVRGATARAEIGSEWLSWWAGDLAGVILFLPFAIFRFSRPFTLPSPRRALSGFGLATLCSLLVPFGLTIFTWAAITQITRERNQATFETLAADSRQALTYRLDRYIQSLTGGAGLFQASDSVGREDWETYVEMLDIGTNLPGISGLGYIEPLDPEEVPAFLREMRESGLESLTIHPTDPARALFVVKYLEPYAQNAPALGLNFAFEQRRYDAAIHARDTGKPTITRRITLVQDQTRGAGFHLLLPLYEMDAPIGTVTARRAAHRGWIFAPFVARHFMQGLTVTQGEDLDIAVYDTGARDIGGLIYASGDPASPPAQPPLYSVTAAIGVAEETWTVIWQSTPAFEARIRSSEPMLILAGGVSLTLLFGALIFSYARREDAIRDIVDQQTREIAARAQQTRSIVETAVVAIVVFDAAGHVRSANRAVEAIFGFSAAEVLGRPVRRLLPDVDAARTGGPRRTQGSVNGDIPPASLMQARTRNGDALFLDVQLNEWVAEDGSPRVTAVINNVTLAHEMTASLRASEERWNSALEGTNIGVFDINIATDTSFVSDTWRRMLGFDPTDEIDAQAEWRARIHPDDRAAVETADRECLIGSTGRAQSEYRIRRRDGKWIWVRSDAVVIERRASGEAARMIGTQMEVSELREAAAALVASEERFRSAMEDAPVGMALLSLDGRWVKANGALCDLLGYSEKDLLQTNFQSLTYPEDLQTDLELVDQLQRGQILNYQLEKRYIHKEGHVIWGLLSVSMSRDAAGMPDYFISQILDISARKEMEQLKNDFVATVSHELRTPLTSIRGSLGLIVGSMAADLPPNANRLLSIAHNNCERLIRLINEILDLEKLAGGGVRFALQRQNLREQVTLAIDANHAYADGYGVTYALSPSKDEHFVNVDQVRLQQVLSNLLSNAAKFSPRGGTVTLRIKDYGKTVRVYVTDTGAGVPGEFKSRIFKRFSQANSSATRKAGGTGLGLHISKELVERMGGVIGFESTLDEGSTFWFEFPHDSSLEITAIADQRAPRIRRALATLPRALHLEDDADFSEVLTAALAGRIGVTHAATLAEGRRSLAQHPFDVVIIDPELPDGNGLDLLADLPAEGAPPVIVVSASETTASDPRIVCRLVKSQTSYDQFVERVLAATLGRAGRPHPQTIPEKDRP